MKLWQGILRLMKYKYIDAHAHVNFPEYEKDREEVILEAEKKGIIIVNVGTDLETSKAVVALSEKYENCYAIIGLHPTHNEKFNYEEFKKLAGNPKVVAIGECGLDFFREPFNKEKQEKVFKQQIDLALEVGKPLMIHARNSYKEILTILDNYLMSDGLKLRGNVHFFAGTVEEGAEFIKRGFTLSYTGVITFAKEYKDLVTATPNESILSETDCPFVTPVPYRGQRNSPLNIPLIVAKMAEIKGIPEESMSSTIRENFSRLFNISLK
jgi:TatD DNase family protein